MTRSPNLVYIFADQMRASALGCMHDENVFTPNLDRLASQGMLFTNAIANSPVCTPSRASMITGKHALNARCFINDIRLPDDPNGIAYTLNKAGYRSAYIGKWHLDGISRHMFTPPERRQGFNDYWASYNCHHDYLDPKYYLNDSSELIHTDGYEPEVQTDLAIQYLRQEHDQPFNLWISFGTPHDPYDRIPQWYLDQYPPESITYRPNALSPDPKGIAGYYAHITALDAQVGRIMDTLDECDLTHDTLLIFTSDHGDMLWSHMLKNKQLPYEESIHIPLIMRFPGVIEPGQRSDLLLSVVDFAPTILSLLNINIPESMEGQDCKPHILGATAIDDEPGSVFINNYAAFDQARGLQPWRGIRTHRYTYARWLQGTSVLFDNRNDPYQMNNLVNDPASAKLLSEMELALETWLMCIGDSFQPAETHIRDAGQYEEWFLREEHFHGGLNY